MAGKSQITYTISPSFRALGKFAKTNPKMVEKKRAEMRALGQKIANALVNRAPRKTGEYARSINFKTYETNNVISLRFYAAQPLTGWIRGGTKPHIIAARNAKNLRFYWDKGPRGAGIYFYPYVHHPGTKPNDFFSEVYSQYSPEMRATLSRMAANYAQELAQVK